MQEELRQLIVRHCGTVSDKIDKLCAVLGRLNSPQPDVHKTVNAAIALASDIRGSAGSIGFGDISSATKSLESALNMLRTDSEKIPTAVLEDLFCRLEILTNANDRLTPESSHLFYADISLMLRHQH